MTYDAVANVAASVCAEAAEDFVGLFSVVRQIRRLLPLGVDDNLVRDALEATIAQVLASGCTFGQFGSELAFVPWPRDQVVSRVRRELATLGRDPDIGEVGWFVVAA